MKPFILVVAAAASLAGCAGTDTALTEKQPASELVYRTGSNIPIRNRAPATKEEKERQKDESQRSLESIQRGGAASTRQ